MVSFWVLSDQLVKIQYLLLSGVNRFLFCYIERKLTIQKWWLKWIFKN